MPYVIILIKNVDGSTANEVIHSNLRTKAADVKLLDNGKLVMIDYSANALKWKPKALKTERHDSKE